MGFTRILAAGIAGAILTACGGGSASPPANTIPSISDTGPVIQAGMPAPFNPATDTLASLDRMTLTGLRSSDAGDLSTTLRAASAGRALQSTIQPGDAGFAVGLATARAVSLVDRAV